MKREPLIASFVLFIALCASAAYWAMQLFKPAARPIAAPPRAQVEVHTAAAAGLFGGRGGKAAVDSNYQLRGVIFSGHEKESVAIISANGQPPQALRVDEEIAPGVTIKEVHRDYILLTENGATKRVELPEDAKGVSNTATVAPVGTSPATPPAQPALPPNLPTPGLPSPGTVPPQPAQQQPAPTPTQPEVAPQPAQPVQPQPAPGQAPAVQTAPPTVTMSPRISREPVNPPAQAQ
jgi:general secretion pathway protein C